MQLNWIVDSLRQKGILPKIFSASGDLLETFSDCFIAKLESDSRKTGPSDLFVAIEGQKFDGHDFIKDLAKNGVAAVLCKKVPNECQGLTTHTLFITVPDPVLAYRILAHSWRKQFDIPVIAIGGSVGKTTTKEMIASLLEGYAPGQVLKTQASQNGYLGIPMTLFNINSNHKFAVIEIGIDQIGAMEEHLDIVEPTAGLLTAIGPEHLENLIDIPTVAKEEGLLLKWLIKNKKHPIVINLDDPWIRPFCILDQSAKISCITLENWPLPKEADHLTPDQDLRAKYQAPYLIFQNGVNQGQKLLCPLPGIHNARNLLASYQLCKQLGLNDQQIQAGLNKFEGAKNRSELVTLKTGQKIICDYYNSNPTSVLASLNILNEIQDTNTLQKWVCLGDMLELGQNEYQYHKELALPLIEANPHTIVLYGKRMKALYDQLLRYNFKGQLRHYFELQEMSDWIKSQWPTHTLLLIKASRSIGLEALFERLQ